MKRKYGAKGGERSNIERRGCRSACHYRRRGGKVGSGSGVFRDCSRGYEDKGEKRKKNGVETWHFFLLFCFREKEREGGRERLLRREFFFLNWVSNGRVRVRNGSFCGADFWSVY